MIINLLIMKEIATHSQTQLVTFCPLSASLRTLGAEKSWLADPTPHKQFCMAGTTAQVTGAVWVYGTCMKQGSPGEKGLQRSGSADTPSLRVYVHL